MGLAAKGRYQKVGPGGGRQNPAGLADLAAQESPRRPAAHRVAHPGAAQGSRGHRACLAAAGCCPAVAAAFGHQAA